MTYQISLYTVFIAYLCTTPVFGADLAPGFEKAIIGTTYETVSFNPKNKGRVFITILPENHAILIELRDSKPVRFAWRVSKARQIQMWPEDATNVWTCDIAPDGKSMKIFSDYHKKTKSAKAVR